MLIQVVLEIIVVKGIIIENRNQIKIIKVIVTYLGLIFILGCSPKPSLADALHKQGYYNCINSGGESNYCTKRHNYRE